MRFDWFDISNEEKSKWIKICPPDEYRVYDRAQFTQFLSPIIPTPLLQKYDSVLIAGSAADSGVVYYMANGNRVDNKAGAVDQMPLGLVFIDDNIAGSGCLIQHGNWVGRTTYPPSDFWNYVSASGIQNYYPLSELPDEPTGSLGQLKIDSQSAAFGTLVNVLSAHIYVQQKEDQENQGK